MQNNRTFPDFIKLSGKLSPECATSLDTDYFINTFSAIQATGARPELIASIITSYAFKYLPDLSKSNPDEERVTTSWARKKLFIETLVGMFPPDRKSITCSFLLRALRVANMVGVGPTYRAELQKRVSCQLDRAELEELMIPCFSHACGTLLDFELVLCLVKGFVDAARSGAALMKVSKLVDSYLAEAAIDLHLGLPEFVELASLLPSHARSLDDGLYRAIDTYLKAHPALSKQDRKRLFNLIDSRKLSTDASLHAAQNERLPVRAVIKVLLSEQNKLSKHIGRSGSFNNLRSPVFGLEGATRCLSKREMNTPQRMEIRRLKEDLLSLQSQCMKMEKQIEKLLEEKKGHFSWKRIWSSSA